MKSFDAQNEIAKIAKGVPCTIYKDDYGNVTGIEYQKEWREGGTEAVDTGELDEAGLPVIEYKENYKDRKLTQAQIKELDAFIKKIVE